MHALGMPFFDTWNVYVPFVNLRVMCLMDMLEPIIHDRAMPTKAMMETIENYAKAYGIWKTLQFQYVVHDSKFKLSQYAMGHDIVDPNFPPVQHLRSMIGEAGMRRFLKHYIIPKKLYSPMDADPLIAYDMVPLANALILDPNFKLDTENFSEYAPMFQDQLMHIEQPFWDRLLNMMDGMQFFQPLLMDLLARLRRKLGHVPSASEIEERLRNRVRNLYDPLSSAWIPMLEECCNGPLAQEEGLSSPQRIVHMLQHLTQRHNQCILDEYNAAITDQSRALRATAITSEGALFVSCLQEKIFSLTTTAFWLKSANDFNMRFLNLITSITHFTVDTCPHVFIFNLKTISLLQIRYVNILNEVTSHLDRHSQDPIM